MLVCQLWNRRCLKTCIYCVVGRKSANSARLGLASLGKQSGISSVSIASIASSLCVILFSLRFWLTVICTQSCVNLLFGHYFTDDSGGSQRKAPSDFASAIFSYLANAFGWNIDVHTWSKIAGLILVGSIIMVNLNFVLGYVSRVSAVTACRDEIAD